MEFKENKIRQNIRHLVSLINVQCEQKKYLQAFLQKKILQEKDVENLLNFLSSSLLEENLTVPIALAFEDCLLLLVTNAVADNNNDDDSGINEERFIEYQRKAVALAKLMHLSLSVKRYALNYFSNKPAIFSPSLMDKGVTNKKPKANLESSMPSEETIIKCCYYLLKANVNYFKELWNWSDFIERYVNVVHDKPSLLKLYINHILALLTNMSPQKLRSLNADIPEELLLEFDEDLTSLKHSAQSTFTPTDTSQQDDSTKRTININLNSSLVTNIEGVLLPIYNRANYEFYSKTDGLHDSIVRVDSTKVNLRSIALGTTAGKAICLSGPVGCGKTTLVEYLARKTGRICPKQQELENEKDTKKCLKENQQNGHVNIPKVGEKRKSLPLDVMKDVNETLKATQGAEAENGFVRVQLGDQTDCKTLLGQYHCTDVPGEFIWLPGVLTQAVMNGYWLLLEDLDSATTDTFTVLSGLLENQYLSVPGFRDCVKIAPGFQLFVTVRNNKSSSNSSQKALFSLLEKYLYTINILPLSRNELCKVVSTNYTKLATVANRIVDVFLTFSKGNHDVADNLRQQETEDRANNTEQYLQLPHEEVNLNSVTNSGRLVSTRDLIKLCQRSNPVFSVTSSECAYFVFQNAVDIFCSYLPNSKEKTKLITSIGAKLGIIQSRCEHFAEEYKPEVQLQPDRIKVGRAELKARSPVDDVASSITERVEEQALKRFKLANGSEKSIKATRQKPATFSFTRLASCLLERVAVCVANAEPILLVGETGVGKTSSVQYLAERTKHKLVVINMNNQSDVSDLVGGFKPVDLACVIAPLRTEFEILFRKTFNQAKNEAFLTKFSICYNQGNFSVVVKLMLKIIQSVFEKSERNELRDKDLLLLPRWLDLKIKLHKLNNQLSKSINISFAFIPGSLVKCIKNGDWVLLDEINLASAETLECLSTILEPEGSVVLLEKGDFIPVKRHPDFRIFACMNPNTDIGKKDLSVGIRNRFTEFFVDEVSTEADLSLLISDYLSATGIQKKSVMNIVKLYKRLKQLAKLELNDGLGNRPVYSLRTLCRSLAICAKNLCGSIERNLYESFCLSFLTQLDPVSHNVVEHLIKEAMLSNAKAILGQGIPKPGDQYLNFEGYWIQQGPKELEECSSYILTDSVKKNLRDLARIISIGKLPILLQGPTSAGKTSLIDYVARRSGNHCLRINNHEHTDLQEYIGTYTADASGKLSFKEGVLVQAMRNGYWIILDELNLASTEILEALNRVLDDNRELFIPETQTVVKAHPNFMLFATQNPPGLYGGRKTLSRAFKNRFIELHFSDIPRNELEIILEKKCLIPPSYARKMVSCMMDLQKNRKTTTKNVFTLRDLFRWGIRYTLADKKLLEDNNYDWNQHLIEEGYLVLSAKVRSQIEIDIIEEALFKNFRKRINLATLFDAKAETKPSPVTKDIIEAIRKFTERSDIVWTRNMTRMAVLTAKALQFDEPVLLVGPTGCGKTTVCQILAAIKGVNLRILNCHMHTEGADFLGGLRPCRSQTEGEKNTKLFEWTDGPLIQCMQEGCYFMADEISLAEDSVLERLNCVLEPERTVLLAEKGGLTKSASDSEIVSEFLVKAREGFQFLATMNPGGDFGKKELSPALRNRFAEIWCQPSDSREDLIQIASNCILNEQKELNLDKNEVVKIASFIVEVVLYMKDVIEKFKYSVRDILAMANYLVRNQALTFPEKAVFGLETIFLDALEMLTNDSMEKVENLRLQILEYAIKQADVILKEKFTLSELKEKKGVCVEYTQDNRFGIKPFFIETNLRQQGEVITKGQDFLFDAPTTKQNLFRLLSALSLQKPILLEGPPGVGKTSIVENVARAIGYNIVRINLCEHTDLADLFGTDLPAEDNILNTQQQEKSELKSPQIGSFVWRDGPLLSALKADHTWILLDELNLAPQSVLEGLNAILDHRGEVYIPELNKTFALNKQTRIFASQNPLKQGGGRKGLPQSFLNRFTKVYVRKLTTEDLLHVIEGKYHNNFLELKQQFIETLPENIAADDLKGSLFDIYKVLKSNSPLATSMEDDITFDLALRLVRFSETLDRGISTMEFGYRGGPYEINLRDILRWCDLLIGPKTGYSIQKQATFQQNFDHFLLVLYERMKLVYYQRMRCEQDKQFIRNAFAQVFQCDVDYLNEISEDVSLYWTAEKIYINDIVLERDTKPLRSSKDAGSGESSLPLLLASQRETLKNVIECLHMEKPVLLCGSTDSGKTKIIDAVCCLSNQLCNTDNIDDSVTGSFQQIDLNRHLEEISKQVETIYLNYIQEAISDPNSSKKNLIEVYDSWSSYSLLSNSKCEFRNKSIVSEELTIYRKRIANLNICIEKLCEYHTKDQEALTQLKQMQNLLHLLRAHVENADTLNTGGYFEWVDSQIVRSLKYGQYISLEHVNLCSSAVLDRLNPVFEPNGCLMISEKGVAKDSDLTEVVRKAPNFRAFLTIDPKNGELSRAMRNRCVELALAGNGSLDLDDKRLLVYNQGIYDLQAINSLIAIHEGISALTEINNFSVSHLIQMAFLVASYKRIGYQMQRAIYVSAMEVYVYSAHIDLMGYGLAYYQNKLREIVAEESQKYGDLKAAGQTEELETEDYLKDVLLNCNDLNETSMIKLQLVPLRIALKKGIASGEQLKQVLQQVFAGFSQTKLENVQLETLLKYVIYMLYESSSVKDLKLRHLLLNELLQNHTELKQLSDDLYESTKAGIQELSLNTIGNNAIPWNPKLYPRIRDYNMETLQLLDNKSLGLSSVLIVKTLLQEIPHEAVSKLSNINAITYSQAVAQKTITDKLNNEFLQYYSKLMENLDQVLKSSLKYGHIDMKSFIDLHTSVLWFNRLLEVSQGKLFINKEINVDLLDKLQLHFKWLDKKLIKHLEMLLPGDIAALPELKQTLEKVRCYIESVKHPLNIVRKLYAKQLMQFQPFYREDQIKLFTITQQMDQLLQLIPQYGSYSADDVARKFSTLNSDTKRKLHALLQKYYKKYDFTKFNDIHLDGSQANMLPENLRQELQRFINHCALDDTKEQLDITPEEIATIEEELSTLASSLNVEQPDEMKVDQVLEKPKEIDLLLLALREFYLVKYFMASLYNTALLPQALLPLNYEYCEEVVSLNNNALALLGTLTSKEYQMYRTVCQSLANNLTTNKDMHRVVKYLNGGYRQFTSLQRLLNYSLQHFQMSSVHGQGNYILSALRNNEDVASISSYQGPCVINTLCDLLLAGDGGFKPVPLCNLDLWRSSLEKLNQIMWHNSLMMTPSYCGLDNLSKTSVDKAKRLILEIEYVQEMTKAKQEDVVDASNYMQGFQKLFAKLKEQVVGVEETKPFTLHRSLANQQKLFSSAVLSTISGALELCLLTFTPLIDPVEKSRLKNNYLLEDIQCLLNMSVAFEFLRIPMKYKHLGHEINEALQLNMEDLKVKQSKFEERVALRPNKCLYTNLVKDLTHFLNTNCDPNVLYNFLMNITELWSELTSVEAAGGADLTNKSVDACNEVVNKLDLWLANSQRFIHHTMKPYYGHYQDFMQPIQCAINQLSLGFHNLKIALTQVKQAMLVTNKEAVNNVNAHGKLHLVLENIMEFPSDKTLAIYNVNSSKDILQNRCPIFSVLNEVQGSERDYFQLLKAKLLELKNRVNISNILSEDLYKEFDFAFNIINQIWQQEEERRRQKKKEDESLYATKTKCQDEDEELQEMQEIEEMFPTGLQEDFGEFVQEDTLEKVMKLDKKKAEKLKNLKSPIVKDEDYAFIANTFAEILINYTQAYYHQVNKPSEKLDFVEYFKKRLSVFSRIYSHYKAAVNESMDQHCYNSLCFSISLQQDLLTDNCNYKLPQKQHSYNFYKDSNITEILNCTEVLSAIEERVDKELALYPEHATLLDIKRIIARIRLLPSTASVVRFNTGFQLLRQKVAQWNEVAHKNNHLKTEEQEIAEYVQRWTRLELQFWRNCMSQTEEKVETSAYKYWFFIYNLFQEYLAGCEIDPSLSDIRETEKRFADLETQEQETGGQTSNKSKVDLKDILQILRQFVESSCYGDFEIRLQLLLAFELYLHNSLTYSEEKQEEEHHKKQLIYGLRNLQLYFAQFGKEVEEHNKAIRGPIEKKLKELVKIESYNKDLSYFSMRNNVARVHRNLNKFLKEYEKLLKEKITAVFQPQDATAKDYNMANDKGKDLRQDSTIQYCRVDGKMFMLPQKLKPITSSEENTSSSDLCLLHKVQKLFNTSRNVVKETVTNAVYPKLTIALDTLLSEQLERCEHLRNLTVDRSKERPKQVLEAKSILQQKRKGLTDLFKILSNLGLNYKTGLLETQLRTEFEDFTLPAFCIKTMLRHVGKMKGLQPQILQLNENIDLYFHKSVFKLKLLQNIMLTPLSELGPPNIERIKGFAVDFFLLVQNQRQLLAQTTKNIYDYHLTLQQIKQLEAVQQQKGEAQSQGLSSLDFQTLRDHYNTLKTSFIKVRYVFEQFKLLWNCVPKKQQPENSLFQGHNLLLQNSEQFNTIVGYAQQILKLCKSTLKDMFENNHEFLCQSKLEHYQEAHNNIQDVMEKLLKCFEISATEFMPIAKPLIDLNESLLHTKDHLKSHQSSSALVKCKTDNFENITPELENIIHSILMALQKLYKKHPSKTINEENGSPKRKEDDSEDDLQEQHLKSKIYGGLKDDWLTMQVDVINSKLSNILLNLKLTPPSAEKQQLIQQLLSVQPLLEQFNLMAEYYLLQQLGAHKISVKILSIVLTVFVEISTKGFCVPQDLMQDEQGEQKKDQKEGEGFGLEDGTGEKDASDKIESEDQLEDAKRPEDRKEEQDKTEDQEKTKEEKGIEMSEDFEGKSEKPEKPEEDDSGESEDEEELNKEMGDTEEGAEKLDDQIWGDDEEEQEEEEKELEEEEDGKGSKDEKDDHNDLNSKDEQAKDSEQNNEEETGLDSTNDPKEDKRKQQEKDIEDMKDQEQDDEQVNPYHNELEEPPEPEDFDMGDMNMDDKEENEQDDKGEDHDNPFDIDTMKESMPEQEEKSQENDDENQDENPDKNEGDSDDSEDEEDETGEPNLMKEDKTNDPEKEEEENPEDAEQDEAEQQKRGENVEEEEEKKDDNEESKEEKPENYEQSKDKSSKEENVQSTPDTEVDGSKDQMPAEQTEKDVQQEQTMDEQDTGEEKDGVGQAENDTTDGGHQGIAETKETATQEERKNERKTEEKRRQGQTNEERTLGEAEKNKIKQLKTIDKLNEKSQEDKEGDNEQEQEVEADEYQHVKDPKANDKTTLDNATEEQSKKMQHLEDEEKKDQEDLDGETNENMDLDETPAPQEENDENLQEMSAEKLEKNQDKPSKSSEKTNERAETQEEMEIEGEIVQTITVPRSNDTTAHCNTDLLLNDSTNVDDMTTAEALELRKLYQQQVTTQKPSAPTNDDQESWQVISNRMTQNARDLCEQLRLILEPTKCTRLKGDYRTGRRINMKKIIHYIASQFRKDKIWLRRTKPAQRDYKITIAIDDSKSMHHNNSKTLTLEAISLVSQALTLLESGRLSVVSFGEQPQILLHHTEQFDGPKLVNSLQFAQDKTKIAGLLDFIRTVNAEEGAMGSSDNGLFENLLLILSDGRNIFSEGKMKVKNAIKLARLQRIFLVYIIIDNPDNKNSILDIQTMEMLPDKSINIKSYLDDFPFPYYVIVRDLNQLPLVLSEAMRQWFEMVNSEQ
ncbi:midasin [Musca autumnalis]|uniref:midasin n=1 Tax=Musca autumnalis TaxID=221902 RepID=UPI003CF3B7DF